MALSVHRGIFTLAQTPLLASGSTLVEQLETITHLDNTWFDGTITYSFEVVLSTPNAARTAEVVLREKGQTTTLATVTSTATTPERKIVTFTYPGAPQAAKEFTVWARSQHNAGDCNIHSARILVDQSGSFTKIATGIPIGSYAQNTGTSQFSALNIFRRKNILWEAGKYDGTLNITLQATARHETSGSGNAGGHAVREFGSSTIITGSDTSVPASSTTWTLYKSGDFSANITNGQDYELGVKRGQTGTTHIKTGRAEIVVRQSGSPNKTKVFIPVGWDGAESLTHQDSGVWSVTGIASNTNVGFRTLIEDSKWSDISAHKFMSNARNNPFTPANAQNVILQSSTVDVGGSLTDRVTNDHRTAAGDMQRIETTIGSWNDGLRYSCKLDSQNSGNILNASAGFVCIEQDAAPVGATDNAGLNLGAAF